MADSEVFYPSKYTGRHNNHGSLPVKADTKYPKGTMVARDANGRAARPDDGLQIHGVSEGDFDNTDAGPRGNLGNDAFNVELTVGNFEFAYDGTAPKPEQVVYALDNRTVTLDSDSGARGIAGVCTEAGSGGKCVVMIDPVMNGALKSGVGLVQSESLTITAADLTDADGSQTFNLGSALPTNAVVIGHSIDVTAAFTDGAAGVFSLDVGYSDVDAIVDGASLAAIAKLHGPLGVRSGGRYDGVQMTATVLGTVNVTTATLGSVTVEIFYVLV